MSSITYRVLLWRAQKSGLCAVHFRVTAERKHVQVATGVEIPAAQWNPKGTLLKLNWVRTSHPDAELFNGHLGRILRTAQQLSLDGVVRTAAEFRDEVARLHQLGKATGPVVLKGVPGQAEPTLTPEQVREAARRVDFLVYYEQEVARRAATGHPRTVEKLAVILQKIRIYLAPPRPIAQTNDERAAVLVAQTLPFTALTRQWLRDYGIWLGQRGNQDSTIAKELSFIKTIVRQAVEDKVLPESQNPFTGLRLPGAKATTVKVRLSREEVTRLEALVLPRPTREGQACTGVQLARATWLLQYYLLGTRIGDVLTLRWRDVSPDAVRFVEHKTGKRKVAPRGPGLNAVLTELAGYQQHRPPRALDFVVPALRAEEPCAQYPLDVEWYLLARMPAHRPVWTLLLRRVESITSSLNGNLKEVQELLGLTGGVLTTHTARHSFANAGRQAGIPAAHMRDMLLHHSVAQTETYFGELQQSEVSDWARQVYGG